MLIGILSDTHGDLDSVKKAVQSLDNADLWLHAGDCSQDADFLRTLTGSTVVAVAGNCDGRTTAKMDEFIQVGGKCIWLTHGHRYGVKHNFHELIWWGQQYEADVIVYGHTHVADVRRQQELLLINPGSAARSRWNTSPTCGKLIVSSDGEIQAEIIEI